MKELPTHILVDRQTMLTLVAVAESGLMELEDGLKDGTYEDDGIAGIPSENIRIAIATGNSVMS
jgi:hypothetical protein